MNSHPVVLREQGLDARQHHLHADKEPTRLGHRSKEMARKKMEFSQKQADRLIGLAEETRDPQLRAQLVIMSKAWIDQDANTRCGLNCLMFGGATAADHFLDDCGYPQAVPSYEYGNEN
jgi:hypothetical protein